MHINFIVLAFLMIASIQSQHPIFCSPQILDAVANSNYFSDSKTFVDLVLKVPIEEALEKFKTQNISDWIQSNFITAETILQPADLPDYQAFPSSLKKINDPQLLKFGLDLNQRWLELARKVNLNYKENCSSNCSSFVPFMNQKTIIIPGGRFKESYYWDSYWIIQGLIVCDMLETAEKLIQNFIQSIETYGFIPNGFRLYYLNRSQPPFFGLMVRDVSEAYQKKGMHQKAEQLQKKVFPHLIAEHKFFMTTHSTEYKLDSERTVHLNVYNANTETPRPQSFKEDRDLVKNVTDENEKKRILKGISSMAESGWDFSSRWLRNYSDLKSSIINEMIPSDLNTLMGLVENYLIRLCFKYKRDDLKLYYQNLVSDRKDYFNQIYNGIAFPDFIKNQEKNQAVYPSDFYPFLLIQKEINLKGLFQDVINPVTSPVNNGMQWDKPNVWAPNNWILHEVLPIRDAFRFAKQWITTSYCSWKRQSLIYEKYRNDEVGKRGQGGEYGIQTGFGWTNGLALYYLNLYGDQLEEPSC